MIVGSGAGGGVAAEILSAAGLAVIVVEEGPLRTRRDFHMIEAEAYPDLYQESAARKTADKAINILQGRCVGGGTTVNWTSSFRTPPATLGEWASAFGIEGFGVEALAPWFARMEARLAVVALAGRAQCEQRRARPRRRGALHLDRNDPPQRPGLRRPRLLRHGLPARRQAVDAGDDDSRRARPRGHARHARPGARLRAGRRAHRRPRLRGHGRARRAPDGSPRHAAREDVRRRRRRHRHAGAAAAQPRCPIRTRSSAGARSCTRPSCRRR